jgi:hypothetical protein
MDKIITNPMTLTQQLENLILETIGDLEKKSEKYVPFQKIHYQSALQDIREKVPALAEQLLAKLNQE